MVIGPIGPMRPITFRLGVAEVRVRFETVRLILVAYGVDGLEVRRTAIGTGWRPWSLGFFARCFGGVPAS